MKKGISLFFKFPFAYVLSKRFWKLLFKGKVKASFFLSQKPNSEDVHFTDIQLRLRTDNALFIIVNKTIIPVFHETTLLDIILPLTKGENKFSILIFGVLNYKKLSIHTDAISRLKIEDDTLLKSKALHADLITVNNKFSIQNFPKQSLSNIYFNIKNIENPNLVKTPRISTVSLKIKINQPIELLSSLKNE